MAKKKTKTVKTYLQKRGLRLPHGYEVVVRKKKATKKKVAKKKPAKKRAAKRRTKAYPKRKR